MVDCGSIQNTINFLNKNKIDNNYNHHNINYPYPKSNVLINPKKNVIIVNMIIVVLHFNFFISRPLY